jgi:hypothetical protein
VLTCNGAQNIHFAPVAEVPDVLTGPEIHIPRSAAADANAKYILSKDRRDASPLSTCAETAAKLQMAQAYASDREISMATTLSTVDGALDLGQCKRRPLQIGMALANARLERARNTPKTIEENSEVEAGSVTETA